MTWGLPPESHRHTAERHHEEKRSPRPAQGSMQPTGPPDPLLVEVAQSPLGSRQAQWGSASSSPHWQQLGQRETVTSSADPNDRTPAPLKQALTRSKQ